MRGVIDANVLIAAYAARGLCEAVLELCLSNDDIVLTSNILTDVHKKLIRKIKVPIAQTNEIVEFLKNNATVVVPAAVPENACRDRDDYDILGAAKCAAANYIISGDEDLLILGRFKETRIVTPRRYWEEFRKRRQ